MSKRAEERAWEVYPLNQGGESSTERIAYMDGYTQAEKDMKFYELSWRDVQSIIRIADNMCNTLDYEKVKRMGEEGYYSEVLKRFNDGKQM